MKTNPNEYSKETIEKAMACKTADELMALAKREGYELTKDEAEAYLAERADVELSDAELKKAAGGVCWDEACPKACYGVCHADILNQRM